MIRIQQLKLPVKHTQTDIENKIRKLLGLKPGQEFTFQVVKQSVDARKKHEVLYVYTADIELIGESPGKGAEGKIVKRVHNKNIMLTQKKEYAFHQDGKEKMAHRPLIAGSGPAGLFCAYLLAMHGYRPVVLERGKKVGQRFADVQKFWEDGLLDPSSNVQFGEGGAGTFSDGKLNTLVKDSFGRNRFVLGTFVKFGADSSILYVNKPHIGTDLLISVVRNMREEIIRLGGEFAFGTCLTDIRIKDNSVYAVQATKDGQDFEIPAGILVLATGHSARDTFEMLARHPIPMEAKPFAVGLRVEHPQEMVNKHQYKGADMRYLPPASYKVTAACANNRGVYSFCMCPGGYVVNASSERQRLAVNGMSYFKRDGRNANSAVIVSVTPSDFPGCGMGPLCGIAFQRDLESKAYALLGGLVPQQLYGDYKNGIVSKGYGGFPSQAKGGCGFADLGGLLPEPLKLAFIDGMERFAQYIPGFNRYDAVLSGVESRTSSPVRILRGEQFQSMVGGIYPCGEGAGYAGGIMSAAMDGMKVAEAIGAKYRPF